MYRQPHTHQATSVDRARLLRSEPHRCFLHGQGSHRGPGKGSRRAEAIAEALNGRRSGKGWMARCPAHPDTTPSLSINETPAGKVLVKCFAGCSQAEVIAALRRRGLWPGRSQGMAI